MACSYAGGTGGLPPRPDRFGLTRVEQGDVWIDEPSQIGAEEILLRAGPTRAHMPALRAGFLLDRKRMIQAGIGRSGPQEFADEMEKG
jgi:hypothetical protein